MNTIWRRIFNACCAGKHSGFGGAMKMMLAGVFSGKMPFKRGLSPFALRFADMRVAFLNLRSVAVRVASIVLGSLVVAGPAYAGLTINSVTLNGGASVTVAPGATITVVVNETTAGGSTWGSTMWRISTTAPGTTTCDPAPSPSITSNGANSTTLVGPITAPATAGTYNAYFIANSGTTCGGGTSSTTFLLASSVIVIPPPTVSSISLASTNPTVSATVVAWTVTFSKSVTGVDTTDFTLAQAGGVTGATITSVTGSGTTWTVTANTGTGTAGTLGLNLVDNDSIIDAGSMPLGGAGAGNGNFTGQVYTLAPTVISINRASADPTTPGTAVSWTVVFSASVTGVNTADFSLVQAGGVTGASITSVTGSGTTWTVTANAGTGAAGTLGLNLVDNDSIIDAGSRPLGGTGAGNGNFTGQVYTLQPFCSPPSNIPAGLTVTCVCDTFGRPSLNPSTIFGGNWALSYGSTDAAQTVPYINAGTGLLRLTENTNNNAKDATVPSIFPAAGNFISVEFNHYAYQGGTTGADGIAVTLSDYSIPAVPGGFGGSLGYAQRTDSTPNPPGFAGGWVGVALDEYGNFQNPTEGRINGPGAIIQSVGVRGPGSGIYGYRWMGGTASNPGGLSVSANSTTTTTAPGYMYQVIVDARNSGTGTINVSVNRDATTKNGSTYTSLFGPFNAYTEANYALTQGWIAKLVPDYWKISFTGSTGGSTNVHEIGSLRICAQSVFPLTGGTASGFSAIDSAYPGSPPAYPNFYNGHIYMKLAGTAFNLYVAALTSTSISTAYSAVSTKYVQVKLVDNTDNACGPDSARTCNSTCTNRAGVEASATQIATFVSGSSTGVASPSPTFTLNSAYKNLIAVMKECTTSTCVAFTATTPACSAGSFSVRPLSISTVASIETPTGIIPTNAAINAGTSGSPKFKAGSQNFNLTATTPNVSGYPSGYNGVMKVNSATVQPGPGTVPGVVSGSFNVAAYPATSPFGSSTSVGNAFTYSEVGGFTLPGYPVTNTASLRGVYDGVDTLDECTTPGLTAAQCDTLIRAPTWTGVDSISTKGDCVLDNYSNTLSSGKYGCNFGLTTSTGILGRFIPDHFAVSATSLVNRSDLCPGTGCPSAFTYMGEQMTAAFTLTAQAAGGGTTKNYVGVLAKLDPTAAGNPLGLAVVYAAVSTTAAGVGATTLSVDTTVGFVAGDALWIPGAGAAGAALNATVSNLTSNTITLSTSIVTAVPAGTNIERDLTGSVTIPTNAAGSFGNCVPVQPGVACISAPLMVTRGATTNYYPALDVGIAPVEGDGVLMSPLDLDASVAVGNDHAKIGRTDVRYGRMKLPNAYGSELLPLPIAVTAQYWNGLNYVTNITDSVSSFAAGSVLSSNCQKLSAVSTWPTTCPPWPTSVSPASVLIVNGLSSFILAAPGTGKTGSVDMTTSAPSYLPSNTARATFGVYKGANEFIYLRENY